MAAGTIENVPNAELLTFHTLYDSPMISVRDYICRDTSHDHSPEEQSEVNGIVLMRHGRFPDTSENALRQRM